MRKLICFLMISFVLVSCSSPENKAGRAAIEHMESLYQLEDIELLSSEQKNLPIAFIVSGLDTFFNGKNYEVVLEVNDSIPVQVEGTVNIRRLELEDYNYVQAKHETYEQKHEPYQQIMKDLKNLGVRDMTVSEEYFDETTRTIYYKPTLTADSIPSDELVRYLDELSNILLENIDTNIRIGLHIDANELIRGKIRSDSIEIRIPAYEEEEYEVFTQQLEEQLLAVQSANRVDHDFIDKLEEYPLEVISSRMEKLDITVGPSSDEIVMKHELTIRALEGYEIEDLLEAFVLLKEQGYGNSYVKLQFTSDRYEPCQVNDVNTVQDLDKCMEFPSIESDYQ